MRSHGQIEAEIVDLFRRYTTRNVNITRATAIYHDLQSAGDDAYELLTEFWERFGVSMDTKVDFTNSSLTKQRRFFSTGRQS